MQILMPQIRVRKPFAGAYSAHCNNTYSSYQPY
jgi:hypothetical protein